MISGINGANEGKDFMEACTFEIAREISVIVSSYILTDAKGSNTVLTNKAYVLCL